MRKPRALPSVRPVTIGEVDRLPVGVMKGIVHAEGAGGLIELEQIQARLGACHDQALRSAVPSGPVRTIGVIERKRDVSTGFIGSAMSSTIRLRITGTL